MNKKSPPVEHFSQEAMVLDEEKRRLLGCGIAGLAAGTVNGIFGAAGGMVLIPLLELISRVPEESLFPMSVSVMLPVCVVSLLMSSSVAALPWVDAAPYLIGSVIGGILAGVLGKKLPIVWLHRILGVMILWGGIRYLW